VPLTHLDCARCNRKYEPGQVLNLCECGGPLLARYDLERAAKNMRPGHLALREPTLWRYDDVLPVDNPDHRISLGEGYTPLLSARRLGAAVGLPRLAVKEESGNPTGSFKARGLSLAVSMAKALGATDVCLPSAGNAGSALAAYAARGGLRAHVFVPSDIAPLFILETRAYGATVQTVDGVITDAGRVCAEQAKQHGWYECATLKEPYRIEGKKTMGYELAEQLGWKLPDAILYPTGGGTGLIGMWKAFQEMETMGFVGPARPRMYAVQAEGCAPIVKAFAEGREDAPMWEGAQTLAHGLRVPKAIGDFLILRALRESHGAAVAVSEQEIIQGVKDAAAAEGLFMAPEGGACVAALRKLKASGHLSADDNVVLFDTGTGFKYYDNMAPMWNGRAAGPA
jgi:threonine synthase